MKGRWTIGVKNNKITSRWKNDPETMQRLLSDLAGRQHTEDALRHIIAKYEKQMSDPVWLEMELNKHKGEGKIFIVF